MVQKPCCSQKLFCLFVVLALTAAVANSKPFSQTSQAENPSQSVVLLHGLIRTPTSMQRIANRLEAEGYTVYNISYPAREIPIAQIVDELHERLKICCVAGTGKLNFVTHSMGGIVVRAYIDKYQPENLGRVVMMGPPNQGSELADMMQDNVLIGFVFGPAIQELGTEADSTPNRLGKVDFELGVITGNRSWNPVASLMIPGTDDGTVSVQRAQVEGMKDFRVMPNTHSFIMLDKDVIDEVVYFLQNGQFVTQEKSQIND